VITWDGLTLSWWLLCRDGSASAIGSDLAGEWLATGACAVMLGTYGDAKAAAERLYDAQPASPAPAPTPVQPPETIPATLFEGVAA
jgi:hypothetical protein